MISIVILVHNKFELSRNCLSALAVAVDGIEHEVICVDNASTEDVSALNQLAARFDKFQFIRNRENWTFSVANNRAASLCKGDFLLFLNNDVLVTPGSIRAFLRALEEPSTGVVGAKLIYPTRKLQHGGIAQMLWGYASNYGAGADPNDDRFQTECERFAVTGAMMCLPQSVFDAIGGFDERYRWGYEDVDLCLKVRAAGFRVRYVPEATAVHVESATLAALRDPRDLAENYQVYRERWDHELVPREKSYVDGLRNSGIGLVAILGTGQAAGGVTRILREHGLEVAAYTSSCVNGRAESFCGRPIMPLESVAKLTFDRLIVASQYFFEFEHSIRPYDPAGAPLFPVLS